jgi:predicted DNA-binding protein
MQISITIPDELEERIASRAAARGLPLEEYAREVLERDASSTSLREIFASTRDQIEATGATDEEIATQIEEALLEVRSRPSA